MTLCECGCGQETAVFRGKSRRFISGHNRRGEHQTDKAKQMMRISKLGDKNPMYGKTGEDHHFFGKKHTSESNLKNRMSHLGIALTMDHIEKIKVKVIRFYNALEDTRCQPVYHHYIYDHNDLSKYRIEMTQHSHSKLHWMLRKAGIKIPHINTNNTMEV